MSGLPKEIVITAKEMVEAYHDCLFNIIDAVRRVLEQTPPELSSDVIDRGIILTGGGSLLQGFDNLLSKRTQIPVFIADNPLTSVAKGTGQALEEIDKLSDMLLSN